MHTCLNQDFQVERSEIPTYRVFKDLQNIGMAIYNPRLYNSQFWQGTDRSTEENQRHIGELIIAGCAENPNGFYVSSVL